MHRLKQYKGELMPTPCTAIWGTSPVPQELGTLYPRPFSFGVARFSTGIIIFFPLSLVLKCISKEERKPFLRKDLMIGGRLCSIAMLPGAYFQQLGLTDTTVGRTGLITTMYTVIIPLIDLFSHRKIEVMTWMSIALAVMGLYFLCIFGNFSISKDDFHVFIGSLFWAIQITLVDTYSKKTDDLELVLVGFVIAGLLSLFCAFQMESSNLQPLTANIGPTSYMGIMVVGAVYTFQTLGQKAVSPAIAGSTPNTGSLLGVISGALMFQEAMSLRGICGRALMFSALMLTQIKLPAPQELLPKAAPTASESSFTPGKRLQIPATQSVESE